MQLNVYQGRTTTFPLTLVSTDGVTPIALNHGDQVRVKIGRIPQTPLLDLISGADPTAGGSQIVITDLGQFTPILVGAEFALTIGTEPVDWDSGPFDVDISLSLGVPTVVHSGTARAGGADSITLDSGASGTNGLYDGDTLHVTGGLGVGQYVIILTYDGGSKVATVAGWDIEPDGTSTFEVISYGRGQDQVAQLGVLTVLGTLVGALP